MKREICCNSCADSWLRTCGVRAPEGVVPVEKVFEIAHGESIKRVRGRLLRSCMCDGCGKDLPSTGDAFAVSVFSDELPYFAWEDEYLEARQ